MTKRGRPLIPIELSEEDRDFLEALTRRRSAPAREVLRARIVLLANQGLGNKEIAQKLGSNHCTVGHWRRRFASAGISGLSELPRSGAPRSVTDEKVAEIVRVTLEEKPEGCTHWSTRKLGSKLGVSHNTVANVWKAFMLQPHRAESFTLSSDPYFVEKVRDVVGLYMDPPENALVFCVDEKSQIQALERSQPMLPLRSGAPERSTHDYFRHGTTSLFAALDVATGKVVSSLKPKHRSKEFLAFLKQIEREVPKGMDVHIVMDNYATHKTVEVCKWLEKRPHWHAHFTPTHASWLNQVERFFALVTNERIRRGSFVSVADLKAAIEEYITARNENPKPFVWKATADAILGKVANLCAKLQ